MARPSWLDYFKTIADAVAARSTCPRLAVGCVIALDDRVIATGYNGSAPGEPHCLDHGCVMEADHCTRATHAEENAIYNAARFGIALQGATAYVTHTPCNRCRRALNSVGIRSIYRFQEYGHGDPA